MTDEPSFDPSRVMEAMAPLLGLTIAHEYRAGLVANLEVAARLAELVMSFPLDDHDEPAAVFTP